MTVGTQLSTFSYPGNPSVAGPATAVAGQGGACPVAGRGRHGGARLEGCLTLGREAGHNTNAQGTGADPGP